MSGSRRDSNDSARSDTSMRSGTTAGSKGPKNSNIFKGSGSQSGPIKPHPTQARIIPQHDPAEGSSRGQPSASRVTGQGTSAKHTLRSESKTYSDPKRFHGGVSSKGGESDNYEAGSEGSIAVESTDNGEMRSRKSQKASQHIGSRTSSKGSQATSDRQKYGGLPPSERRRGLDQHPPIQRSSSVGSHLGAYFDANAVIKVDKPLAQTYAMVENIKDWIDHHDFLEVGAKDAMEKVDWDQFLPHEKLLAYNHAKVRATMALNEHHEQGILADDPDIIPDEPLTLSEFAHSESDKEAIKSFDLDDLPDIGKPGLADDPKLFRTTVVLAMIYRTLTTQSDKFMKTGAEWQLFLNWLNFPTELQDMDPIVERANELRLMGLPEDIMLRGAHTIASGLHDAIQHYSADAGPGTNRTHVVEMINKSIDDLPRGAMDLWTIPTQNIGRWDLDELSSYESDSDNLADDKYPSEPSEGGEPTDAENYRRGLAHGAMALKWFTCQGTNWKKERSLRTVRKP